MDTAPTISDLPTVLFQPDLGLGPDQIAASASRNGQYMSVLLSLFPRNSDLAGTEFIADPPDHDFSLSGHAARVSEAGGRALADAVADELDKRGIAAQVSPEFFDNTPGVGVTVDIDAPAHAPWDEIKATIIDIHTAVTELVESGQVWRR